jgi:uncharacterized protein
MVRIADLDRLQQIDLEADAVASELASVRRELADPGVIADLRARELELSTAAQSARAELRESTTSAEDGREKVGAVAQKLYDGSVTAPRELQDLQDELNALQRQQQERDDRALAALGAAEEADAALAAVSAERAVEEQRLADSQTELTGREAALTTTLDALQVRRQEAAALIDAPSLAVYERVRLRWKGVAIARVQRGVCLGCRVMLPTMLFNKARSGMAIVTCSNCGRILYVV